MMSTTHNYHNDIEQDVNVNDKKTMLISPANVTDLDKTVFYYDAYEKDVGLRKRKSNLVKSESDVVLNKLSPKDDAWYGSEKMKFNFYELPTFYKHQIKVATKGKSNYIKIMTTIRALLFCQLVFIYIPYLIHFALFEYNVPIPTKPMSDIKTPIDIVIDANNCAFTDSNDSWASLKQSLGGNINFLQTRFKKSISNIVANGQSVNSATYLDERLNDLPNDIDITDLKNIFDTIYPSNKGHIRHLIRARMSTMDDKVDFFGQPDINIISVHDDSGTFVTSNILCGELNDGDFSSVKKLLTNNLQGGKMFTTPRQIMIAS